MEQLRFKPEWPEPYSVLPSMLVVCWNTQYKLCVFPLGVQNISFIITVYLHRVHLHKLTLRILTLLLQ
jgi:hypothetical protein